MPVHDSVAVAGVSEACKYCDHHMCRSPGCNCSCHTPAESPVPAPPQETGPEKVCPKCGTKRPFSEVFCRIDGERLSSLQCGVCGAGMAPEDSFCFKCGSPKGKEGKPTTLNVPALAGNVEEPVVDYGRSIVASIQRELENVQIPETSDRPSQIVVEQPAGPGGSFKLVSTPNPNKVRTTSRVVQQPVTQPGVQPKTIRLPVKPS